jgi:predicted GNAT family acetyltransferase
MEIKLEKAEINDADVIHRMQVISFQPLLERYKDYDTNPANEKVEKIIERFKEPFTKYYFINKKNTHIGAVRIIYWEDRKRARISPIFILPEYQGKGYAQKAISLLEKMYSRAESWELDTLLQEAKNCYLYEKIGYKRTGNLRVINDKLTVVSYEK